MCQENEEREEERFYTDGYNTLFIKDGEIPLEVNIDGVSYVATINTNNYIYHVGEFSQEGPSEHEVVNKLREAEPNDTLEVRIDSPGGSVYSGIKLYNVINDRFKGRCTTVLDPIGCSMGALSFCMGDRRIAYEFSSIMFHDYSTFEYGKSGEVEKSLKHSAKVIDSLFKRLVVDSGFLTDREFKKMKDGVDFWFDAEEMARRGIATHIICGGEVFTSEEYLGNKSGTASKEESDE